MVRNSLVNMIIMITFLLILGILLIACAKQLEVVPESRECSQDSDCIVGGCSSQICQSKTAEPIITTCEWKEEYSCYQLTSCGCVEEKCAWQQNEAFDQCLTEKGSEQIIG